MYKVTTQAKLDPMERIHNGGFILKETVLLTRMEAIILYFIHRIEGKDAKIYNIGW